MQVASFLLCDSVHRRSVEHRRRVWTLSPRRGRYRRTKCDVECTRQVPETRVKSPIFGTLQLLQWTRPHSQLIGCREHGQSQQILFSAIILSRVFNILQFLGSSYP
ncbi:uncharacterized protein RBU33_015337 isoform 1-T1 [Hipposideros larvatus]